MADAVKKVGGSKKDKTEKTKKPGKEVFDVATATFAGKAVPGRADGQLQAVPDNWDPAKHKPLRKSDFADTAVYLEYQVSQLQLRADALNEEIATKRKQIARIKEFGDESTRKKATKLMKAREQMAKLEAELAEGGFDLDLLDD